MVGLLTVAGNNQLIICRNTNYLAGIEGNADANNDGKTTLGGMQAYLVNSMAKESTLSNRVQQSQLSGVFNGVLVEI